MVRPRHPHGAIVAMYFATRSRPTTGFCRTNESAAIRLRDDVRGEQALELGEIAGLRRGNERMEEAALLGAADACSPSIRDVLSCAGDELARVGLFDVENLRNLAIWVVEGFAQHVRGAFRRASRSSSRRTASSSASARSAPNPGSALVSTGSGSHGPTYVSRRVRAD